MLKRKGQSLKDVVEVLKIFHENVDEQPADFEAEDASPPQKEILSGLIQFLDGCNT